LAHSNPRTPISAAQVDIDVLPAEEKVRVHMPQRRLMSERLRLSASSLWQSRTDGSIPTTMMGTESGTSPKAGSTSPLPPCWTITLKRARTARRATAATSRTI
jgi:hypothetical protein